MRFSTATFVALVAAGLSVQALPYNRAGSELDNVYRRSVINDFLEDLAARGSTLEESVEARGLPMWKGSPPPAPRRTDVPAGPAPTGALPPIPAGVAPWQPPRGRVPIPNFPAPPTGLPTAPRGRGRAMDEEEMIARGLPLWKGSPPPAPRRTDVPNGPPPTGPLPPIPSGVAPWQPPRGRGRAVDEEEMVARLIKPDFLGDKITPPPRPTRVVTIPDFPNPPTHLPTPPRGRNRGRSQAEAEYLAARMYYD